ncbi:hypothetical protein CE91St14_14650 [Porphyromonas somerae]|uniref:hypothetical protein n=1 Tax=Porphyromonas somerae TaxID=322095 RepID=UPI001FCCBCA5|nr:hypothetical protein [Porphyromonas somerae]BDE82437.1 hypothetical protein CE91St14_14650 [Porphyromonas somerae]
MNDLIIQLSKEGSGIRRTARVWDKGQGKNCDWCEIVRCMSTQKSVTTEDVNLLGEKVKMRQCRKPSQ